MDPPKLSIVIPTLDAAGTLPVVLAALGRAKAAGLTLEIVVADGGSSDGTAALARLAGARWVGAGHGRGRQLADGARAARGEWLLFLHADTVLGAGWAQAAADFIAAPENKARAAVFKLSFDDPRPAARRLERIAAWRARALGLPYGDQGLLMSRDFYDVLGGYKSIPLMEDVDLVRRVGRARLVVLDERVTTSAARYRRGGYVIRPLRNLLCLALFFLGVAPRLIARIYA